MPISLSFRIFYSSSVLTSESRFYILKSQSQLTLLRLLTIEVINNLIYKQDMCERKKLYVLIWATGLIIDK